MRKHGITVREVKTNKLVKFIQCATGRTALQILSGIRRNMSSNYRASEEFINEQEIAKLEVE